MNGEELGRCESEELLINFDEREGYKEEEDCKDLNDNNENVDKPSDLENNDERIDHNDHENEDESFNDIENEPYPHLLSRYKYRVNHKARDFNDDL